MENAENSRTQHTAVQADHDFVRVQSGACVLTVRADHRQAELVGFLLGGERELARRYELERITAAASSRVFRLSVSFSGRERVIYFKEHVARSTWDTLKHLIRSSRARRAFEASMMLARQGFDTPEILALGEVRRVLVLKRCFLVTFGVIASEPIHILLRRDSARLDAVALRRKRDLLRTLGHTIGRMHRRGIVHGDLRPGNILARNEEGRWRLFFLDNERTRRFPWMPSRLRRKNLVQVGMMPGGVSRTDYFRFWLAYLEECPQLHSRRKHWARKVHNKIVERLTKYGS